MSEESQEFDEQIRKENWDERMKRNNSQSYSSKVGTERRTGNSELQSTAIAKGIL